MTREDVNLKDLAEKRKLKVLHIIMDSFLAELAEMGFLNQGSSNIIGTAVGKRIGKFLRDSGYQPSKDDVKSILGEIVNFVDLSEELTFKQKDKENIVVKLKSLSCKYCPKGVGGAEISGTVCPVPYFLKSILEVVTTKKFTIVPWRFEEHGIIIKKPIMKNEGYCQFILRNPS